MHMEHKKSFNGLDETNLHTVQCTYCTKGFFGRNESSSCLKKCESFPPWLHASWWYPYKRWRLNKAAWYGHSTLIRTVGMVLIWIHQPADQDYWSRPDHPKIVKTPPAISRYDGGHASLLIEAWLSNLHQLTPFVKMLFRKNFDDADNATRNIKPLVSLVGSVHISLDQFMKSYINVYTREWVKHSFAVIW